MRNIRKNENALAAPLIGVRRALFACEMSMERGLSDEGGVHVVLDGSIAQDTTSRKRQDMDEVAAGLMNRAEYRAKWYGESGK